LKPKPKAARRPKVGDEAWFVEWCTKQGMVDEDHPEYGCEPDKNVMESRRVASKEEAERVAREVYPLDQQGSVSYWPARFVAYDEDDAETYPHAGHWEATDDAEYYEGEG
jgi:hypothetical protein